MELGHELYSNLKFDRGYWQWDIRNILSSYISLLPSNYLGQCYLLIETHISQEFENDNLKRSI